MVSDADLAAIDALIPHRPPMRLIDAVISANQRELLARVSIAPDSPFVRNARVPAAIGLEYMAQAAAAFFALRVAGAEQPRQGMLIACPRLAASVAFFDVGANLLVRIAPVSRMPAPDSAPGLVKFSGTISRQRSGSEDDPDTVLVSADISVYV